MKLYFTASLLDSYLWYKNCPPMWKEKALIQLNNTLLRKPFTNFYVNKGAQFESFLYKVARKEQITTNEKVKQGAKLIESGRFQVRLKGSFLLAEGIEIHLGGNADVLIANKEVIDIKTTNKPLACYGEYTVSESYLKNKNQHIIYPLIAGVGGFKYLIYQFESIQSNSLANIHIFNYLNSKENNILILKERIKDFLLLLYSLNIENHYFHTYNYMEKGLSIEAKQRLQKNLENL